MEDTLRAKRCTDETLKKSLNPCFNGRYSQRMVISSLHFRKTQSLNPCFNGRYSQSCKEMEEERDEKMS